MKEEIRKEVMKVFNQEDSVDNVVNNILRLFDVSGRSEQLCSCSSKILPDGNIQFSLCRKCQIEMINYGQK
jgi:hypothetical protein